MPSFLFPANPGANYPFTCAGVDEGPAKQLLEKVMNAIPPVQTLSPNLRVLFPELVVGGEGIDHLGPLAVPIRVFVSIQDRIRHIARLDNRAGHNSRDHRKSALISLPPSAGGMRAEWVVFVRPLWTIGGFT